MVSADISLINESDNYGILAVQGPNATALLKMLTDELVENIPFYKFITTLLQ